VLHYIAQKFSNDVRQLEGALNRLLFYSITFNNNNKKIDMQMALNAYKNSGMTQKEEINVDKIKKTVADYYNISTEALSSKIRTSYITTARHIAMYLCRSLLSISLIEIGKQFSNRDHSTVISSCSKVDKLLKTDEAYKIAIDEMKKMLKK
jgi:chromosomal replication initiator protein